VADKNTRILLAYSYWDIIPILAALAHGAFIIGLFLIFPHTSWWLLIPLGIVYAFSISWNINGISHNFIHNPYFKSAVLNRLFSILESLLCGFSQVFYETVHRHHHIGNSDKPDAEGNTIDWISIYQHGHDGHAENPWVYALKGYFREDLKRTYRETARLSVSNANWGVFESLLSAGFAVAGFILNWKFMLYFLPFYYLGHTLSMLQGYYRHYGGNPDEPMAWGVSSYEKLYNFFWFNNGFHAEHHYRPRVHWTKMMELHKQISQEQKQRGVRVIAPPHAFGFLDPQIRALHRAEARSAESRPVEAHPTESHAVEPASNAK